VAGVGLGRRRNGRAQLLIPKPLGMEAQLVFAPAGGPFMADQADEREREPRAPLITRGSCAAILVVWLLGLVVVCVLVSRAGPNVPSVDALVDNYKAHRAEFASIASMTAEDPHFGLDVDSPTSNNDLSPRRRLRYLALLRRIGAQHLGSGEGGHVEVVLDRWGIVPSGVGWGYYHSNSRQPSSSLAQARSGGDENGWTYDLGDGWYAFVERW